MHIYDINVTLTEGKALQRGLLAVRTMGCKQKNLKPAEIMCFQSNEPVKPLQTIATDL